MRTARFFRFVWRVNAVLILLASLTVLWKLAFERPRARREPEGPGPRIGALLDRQEKGSEVTLGDFEPLDGVAALRAPLTSEIDDDIPFSRRSQTVARNYLYVDPATFGSHWLLPSDDQVIVATDDVRFPERCDNCGVSTGPLRATVFLVAERDTNGDDRRDGDDALSLLVAGPAGQPLTAVAHGVTVYHGRHALGPDALVLFFAEHGTLTAATVDLGKWVVRGSQQIQTD